MTPEQQAAIREAVFNAIATWQGGCGADRCTRPMSDRCECALAADAAIAAYLKALEAAGLCVVPIEATKEMRRAVPKGTNWPEEVDAEINVRCTAGEAWRLMLAARPR